MEIAESRLANYPIFRLVHITDHQGLSQAYSNVNKVIYIPSNGKMYIGGTQTMADVADWRYLPLNQFKQSSIYKRADRIASINNAAGIDVFVGHSSGAVAAKLLGEKYGKPYVMYGAPQVTFPRYSGSSSSHANLGDVVSAFDFNSHHELPRSWWNPHGY